MTDLRDIRNSPLSHLDYFAEWGGAAWSRLIRTGLVDYLGGDLSGKRVLDFGSRNGRMSCLFALLGAEVTGLDIHPECAETGRREAEQFGLSSRAEFMRYSGHLEEVAERRFDVIFSKSVLVLVPDLHNTLTGLERLLVPDGRFVFIENGRGGLPLRAARWLRHRGKWDYSGVTFFARPEIDLVSSLFTVERAERSLVPPIHLLCGRKKST